MRKDNKRVIYHLILYPFNENRDTNQGISFRQSLGILLSTSCNILPKYRRPVLRESVARRLRELILEKTGRIWIWNTRHGDFARSRPPIARCKPRR